MASKFVPLTGITPTAITLETPQIGSDDLESAGRVLGATVNLERNGVTISSRNWTTLSKWTINYNGTSWATVNAFRPFFIAKTFIMQPYGTAFVQYTVRWVDPEFRPVYISPGVYSLNFTIEEVVI